MEELNVVTNENSNMDWREFKESLQGKYLLKGAATAIDVAEAKKSYKDLLEAKDIVKELEKKGDNLDLIKVLYDRIEEVEKKVTGGSSGDIGALIRSIRNARGLSLNDLAKLSGVSSSYIFRMEKGERRAPTTHVLEKIANALGEDISTFIKSSQMSIGTETGEQLLASLLMSNSVKITPDSAPLSIEEKTALMNLIRRLNEFRWDDKSKLAETIELTELVGQFKKYGK